MNEWINVRAPVGAVKEETDCAPAGPKSVGGGEEDVGCRRVRGRWVNCTASQNVVFRST